MPLEEAAQILRDGKDEFAESRRRLAIARLAAADVENPHFRGALATLGAPLERVVEILSRRKTGNQRIAGLWNDTGGTGGVGDLLDGLFERSNDECLRTPPLSKLEWIADQRLAKVKVTLSVKRIADGLDGFRRAIDPQNWDRCSDFIAASYVAQEVGGQYPVDADFNAIESTTPPTPGTTWQAPVFEHLAVTFGVTFSWFKHVLVIDSKSDPTTYRFDFALRKSLRSGVLWDERDGGLDVDDGYASGTLRQDGWIDVEATKALRFSERPLLTKLLDTWAVVALAAMGDELWATVCCVP